MSRDYKNRAAPQKHKKPQKQDSIPWWKWLIIVLLITAFVMALLFASFTYQSPWQFLFIIAFIPIFKHLLTVYKTKDLKNLDPELKKLALSTFLFSLLFGLGLIL